LKKRYDFELSKQNANVINNDSTNSFIDDNTAIQLEESSKEDRNDKVQAIVDRTDLVTSDNEILEKQREDLVEKINNGEASNQELSTFNDQEIKANIASLDETQDLGSNKDVVSSAM
jgi:hypothetical protein